MIATLDLSAVRRFTDDLEERVRRCENGEGMICSNLDESISHYLRLTNDLRQFVNEWARAVFTGQVAFDQTVEDLLKEEMKRLMRQAKRVAALGRAMCEMCGELNGLDPLQSNILHFDYLLDNWVSPRLAVNPAARVTVPDEAGRQIVDNLKKLSRLPREWKPTDPVQLKLFQRHRR